MNVLLVDDIPEITESLKNDYNWARFGIDQVYTAQSPREARILLKCFPIDIIITDIEMPEEDGLSLFQWAKQNYPQIEGILLTANADFDYARAAISSGLFSYILQPVDYAELDRTMQALVKRIASFREEDPSDHSRTLLLKQRNVILEGMLRKVRIGAQDELKTIYETFCDIYGAEYKDLALMPILIEVHPKGKEIQNYEELSRTFSQIFEGFLEKKQGRAAITGFENNRCVMLVIGSESLLPRPVFERRLEQFQLFVKNNLGLCTALYPIYRIGSQDSFYDAIVKIFTIADSSKGCGIFFGEMDEELDAGESKAILPIVEKYVKKNISKRISREEVAALVHLNPEYFSRLFHSQSGQTFKEYLTTMKINYAKELLVKTDFSVSTIATKIGYDNFSHFSRTFKTATGLSPQEYRKENIT